jgi:hypothetical protein
MAISRAISDKNTNSHTTVFFKVWGPCELSFNNRRSCYCNFFRQEGVS